MFNVVVPEFAQASPLTLNVTGKLPAPEINGFHRPKESFMIPVPVHFPPGFDML